MQTGYPRRNSGTGTAPGDPGKHPMCKVHKVFNLLIKFYYILSSAAMGGFANYLYFFALFLQDNILDSLRHKKAYKNPPEEISLWRIDVFFAPGNPWQKNTFSTSFGAVNHFPAPLICQSSFLLSAPGVISKTNSEGFLIILAPLSHC